MQYTRSCPASDAALKHCKHGKEAFYCECS
jgi:hypothetical protein